MKALIGYTGFVGSNLAASTYFEGLFNSRNINDSFNHQYELVVYSGVTAEKFLANQNPEQDRQIINQAIENIKKIKTKRLVLISTIDVYNNPVSVNESAEINTEDLQSYGLNRYILEKWVRENIEQSLIVRLPALYGRNLKKNFIFDMMSIVPSMIKDIVFQKLKEEFPDYVISQYALNDNGFYKLNLTDLAMKLKLKEFFRNFRFNALSFTDSRNMYQFYPLKFLWEHINIALKNKISLLCLNSEPISTAELYEYIFDKKFENITGKHFVKYDLRSEYAELFGGKSGYFFCKQFILKDIKKFVTMGE